MPSASTLIMELAIVDEVFDQFHTRERNSSRNATFRVVQSNHCDPLLMTFATRADDRDGNSANHRDLNSGDADRDELENVLVEATGIDDLLNSI
jgi:hypothetical protein